MSLNQKIAVRFSNQRRSTKRQLDLIELIKQYPTFNLTDREISEKLGISERHVRNILNKLEEYGIIEKKKTYKKLYGQYLNVFRVISLTKSFLGLGEINAVSES